MSISLKSKLLFLAVLLLGAGLSAQQLILPVSGVVTIDASPGKAPYEVFVNAAVTSVVFTNPSPLGLITVLFLQDSTGHAVTFGGNIVNPCTVSTAVNSLTSCQFQYDARTVQWTGLGFAGVTVQQGGVGQGSASTLNCSTNVTCSVAAGVATVTASATGATAWSGITTGTNTAALLMGTGGSLGPTGSGTITATAMPYAGLSSFPAPCGANLFATQVAASPGCTQPAFSNLSGSIALGQTQLTTRGDLLTVNSTPALARLALGTSNLYVKSNGTDAVYSTLAAGGIGSCTNQAATALNADAAPTCTTITSAFVDNSVAKTGGTAKQVATSGGAGVAIAYIDFPDVKLIAAANCNNITAGAGWSLPTASAPTAACRTGTNIQDGVLQFIDSQSAQFSLMIPADWDSGVNPSARLYLTQAADTTSGHTIIMQLATSGSTTTDDAAFNTAQSFSTATSTTTANTPFAVTLANFTMTGCTAGQLCHFKVSRTTDSNVSANVYQISITIPRLLTVQAN